jgi:hypothetical protein
MAKHSHNVIQRLPDELHEALRVLRRFLEDLDGAFTGQGNRFDPNASRLDLLLIFVAIILVGGLFLQVWAMMGRP